MNHTIECNLSIMGYERLGCNCTAPREEALQMVTGRLDMSIAYALTWVADNAPLSEVEKQMIDHHMRDMRKVLDAIELLAGPSTTNDKIKALERAL